jgi:serine/threonine protein kinase
MRMESRKSPLDNKNNRRQNSAEKPTDASPSERLQKSRSSHLIGGGINPRDGLGQQVSTDEAREKNAITTPSETDSNSRDNGTGQRSLDLSSRWSQDVHSDLLSTQDRNEKRQLSALEEELLRQWLKSIPLNEYGYRAPKVIDLASISTRDKPILVGGMLGSRFKERGGSSSGDQITDTKGWIGKKLGNYELVKLSREERDNEGYLRWVYKGKLVHTEEELVDVKVPPEAGTWIGRKLGGYDLVEYLREDNLSLFYLGKYKEEVVEVKVLKNKYKKNKEIVEQFRNEAEILHRFGQKDKQNLLTFLGFKDNKSSQNIPGPSNLDGTNKNLEVPLPQNIENMRHPHIVRVLECYKAKTFRYKDDVNYLVMEHASRGTLKDAYPRPNAPDSHWTLEKVVAVMHGLADALDCLHNYKDEQNSSQPHLHGNIRPETVSLDEDERTILSGCKNVRKEGESSKGSHSRGYNSPEKQKSVKSDQYSMAVVAYELLTGGQYPFPEEHTPNMKPESLVVKIKGGAVPTEVQENIQKVLFKAMAYNPGDRYESVKIFAEELEKACFGRIRRQRPSCDEQRNLYIKIARCDVAIRSDKYNTYADITDAYIGKGQAFSELGHDEEAVKVYREAKENTTIATAKATVAHFDYLLGVAYSNLGRYPEAVAAFDNTIRTNEEIARTRDPYSVSFKSDESIQKDIVEAIDSN